MKKLTAYIFIMISAIALLFALGSCGKEETPTHVHTASDWITDKKPTCTEDGSEHKECTECGEVLSENVLKASHSPASAVKENAVAPTCTAEGSYDSVVYCRDCKTELSRKTHTEALAPHTPSAEWITVLEPTCRDFGKRIKECTICHATADEAPINEYADHAPAEAVIEDFVDSTCSAAGSYNSVTYCSVCERKLSSQSFTVEAKAHNPVGDWYTLKKPTCKEEGLKHRICSVCGESGETETIAKTANHNKVIDPSVEPTYTEPGLTAGAHCSICGDVLIAQTVIPAKLQGLDIVSKSLKVGDGSISGTLPNATSEYSFAEDIITAKSARLTVAKDAAFKVIIEPKVALEPGDNVFYIRITSGGEVKEYSVTIKRLRLFVVSFETGCTETVHPRVIEEGSLVEEPVLNRPGYTVAWDYDFSKPVTETFTAKATWSADTDTDYAVRYYIEKLGGDGYEIYEELLLKGTTDTEASIAERQLEHFVFNPEKSNLYGNINGDGSLELALYYEREVYTVSVICDGVSSVSGAGSYPYGTSITLDPGTVLKSHIFGWYSGDELVSGEKLLSFVLEGDVEYTVSYKPDKRLQPFTFSATETECIITGVIDSNVTELFVPECVTSINKGAFGGCTFLTSITLPFVGSTRNQSMTANFDYIFDLGGDGECVPSTLRYVEIYGAKYIPNGSFTGVSTPINVVIGEGVTEIYPYAFSDCDGLISVVLGDDVTTVSNNAFAYCDKLASVTLGKSVKIIGTDAFTNSCAIVEVVNNSDLILSLGSSKLGSIARYAKEVHTGESRLAYRGNYVFYEFDGVNYLVSYMSTDTDLVLPDSFDTESYEISRYTFYNNRAITSVVIGDGVTAISPYAFYYCTTLNSVEFGKNVKLIGGYAFSHCENLRGVTLPECVESIGLSAFESCLKLNEIVIHDACESIGDGAFMTCRNLTRLSIGNGVKTIGKNAFAYCEKLDAVTFGSGIESIGDAAFAYCPAIVSVYISDIGRWCLVDFESSSSNPISINSASIYLNGFILTDVHIPEGTSGIGQYAFYNYSPLDTVSIPSSVTSIGKAAFYGCTSLESVIIPDGVSVIESETFRGCSQLRRVIIGEGVSAISDYAFTDCSQLRRIEIPDKTETIGNYAFQGCSKLFSVTLGSGLTSIKSAFNSRIYEVVNNSSLVITAGSAEHGGVARYATEIRTGESAITDLDGYLFYTVDGIYYLIGYDGASNAPVLPEDEYAIYEKAFSLNKKITSVIIPDTVSAIGSYAFSECSRLTRAVIGNGVKTIGASAFNYCTSLHSVELGTGLLTVESEAFFFTPTLVEIINRSSLTLESGSLDHGRIATHARLIHTGASIVVRYSDYAFATVDGVNYLLSYLGNETDIRLPEDYNGKSYLIYDYAFYQRTDLKRVTLTRGTAGIGQLAFDGCGKLVSIIIPKSVETVGKSAFRYCFSLTIYAEATSKPAGWDSSYNPSNRTVRWKQTI